MNNEYFIKSISCNELCFLKQKYSSKLKKDKSNKNNSDILKLSKIELKNKKCLPC